MRYLLDTNILSNFTKASPSERLVAWMAEQNDEDLYIASFTVAELWRGILEMPSGKRRHALEAWFIGAQGPQTLFAGRILPFDYKAGLIWAELMAAGSMSGRSRSSLDMIIAAIGKSNDCVVVTDNVRDFSGIDVINPIRGVN
ncbi:PIN domain-containing protein [Kozakia baliensis]|nr:PIN domain-containing protein [Kozakia baliensis]GEL65676.1 ribonuclease VapC [Kozakia baliensis]